MRNDRIDKHTDSISVSIENIWERLCGPTVSLGKYLLPTFKIFQKHHVLTNLIYFQSDPMNDEKD